MGKCPFWSSEEEVCQCFEECIMHNELIHEGEDCVFREYLEDDNELKKIRIEDVIKEIAVDLEEEETK